MHVIEPIDLKEQFTVAIIVSRFNEEITQELYKGALQRLKELNFSEHQITVVWVPGAIEIPITAQRLAKSGKYEAIISLGCVIRGETSHYDYVCEHANEGCLKVSLEHELPIIFGVLTTEDKKQALARVGGAHGHKGRESVDAAFELVSVLRQID